MDEGTRGGAAIVQAVIAPRPAVPTIQCPPLLHCRVLAKRSPRISRLNCTFLKTMPALIELVTWLVTHSRFVNRVIIYERSLILFFLFCFVVCSIFFWMCVIRLGEGSVDKFGVELVGLIGKSLI